ncbi:MAG: uracil-DNA glycosylase [Campylobacteraceae bacterium]|nr:uracil-DNA glycosylase [Campylobacteraceae bacterium]
MIKVHSSWQSIIEKCYGKLDIDYRKFLEKDNGYFPSRVDFLNAFKTLPLNNTKYILFGQDPYPRKQSAIGYAFIDGMVDEIFSSSGFSKRVNKATSLRNFIKMLLVANGNLEANDTTQEQISKIRKDNFITDIIELKLNFEKNGVLLLNTSLIFTDKKDTSFHVKQFRPFMGALLKQLEDKNIELILFGNMAKEMQKRFASIGNYRLFKSLHPYNVGFIKDSSVISFFKPMNLLIKKFLV